MKDSVAEAEVERRLTLRAYQLWSKSADGRPLPALRDFDSADLAPFRDESFVVGFEEEDYLQPVYRFVGKKIQDMAGEISQNSPVRGTAPGSVLDRIADHYLEAVAHKSPVAFDAEFERDDGSEVFYRGILLPLSEDGETVDLLMGVLSWKVEAAAAAESVSSTPKQPPAAVTETEEAGEAPEYEGLQARLAACRAAAEDVKLHEGRSHRALYHALAETYLLFEEAQDEPQAYRSLLRQAGLRPQRRAPFTPAVKLVFGAMFEKARLSEYAAVLAYLARQGVAADKAEAYISGFEGGLKGLVAAERAARRAERGAQAGDDSQAMRKRLALVPAMNIEEKAVVVPGDSDYVLLLARRRSERLVEPVGVVPETERRLESILRRSAREAKHETAEDSDDESVESQ